MKKLPLMASILLSSSSLLLAQKNDRPCGTQTNMTWETEAFDLARIPGNVSAKSASSVSIPVVFHVVHNGGNENVSEATVQSALNALNARYANQAPYNDGNGVNTEINFCLAIQDPSGASTTGITYHNDPATNFDQFRTDNSLPLTYPVDSQIAEMYHWPTDAYLNVYIVKAMGNIGSSATFPDQHGNSGDGLFIVSSTIADAGMTHEVGHYLGLYHTFEGMNCTNNDCTTDNDKVCDTPPDNVAELNPQNCNVNTCTSDEDDSSVNNPFRNTTLGGLGDQNDDTRNYMDISTCITRFTQGQKTRMHATISTVRSSLLTSMACQFPASAVSATKNDIRIYPNPVTDHININGADNSTISLFNSIGQLIAEVNADSDNFTFSTTSLNTGVYMLVVSDEQGHKTTLRVIKQ